MSRPRTRAACAATWPGTTPCARPTCGRPCRPVHRRHPVRYRRLGAQRTLERLDWSGLDGLPPKVLAGYSDVTAILEAVGRQARLGLPDSAPWWNWTAAVGALLVRFDAARPDASGAGDEIS